MLSHNLRPLTTYTLLQLTLSFNLRSLTTYALLQLKVFYSLSTLTVYALSRITYSHQYYSNYQTYLLILIEAGDNFVGDNSVGDRPQYVFQKCCDRGREEEG